MPFVGEDVIARLEKNLAGITSVTALLDGGLSPKQLLERVLDGLDVSFTDTLPCSFFCSCSQSRVEKALVSIGFRELDEMIREGEPIEVNCDFCNKKYTFDVEKLKALARQAVGKVRILL